MFLLCDKVTVRSLASRLQPLGMIGGCALASLVASAELSRLPNNTQTTHSPETISGWVGLTSWVFQHRLFSCQ